MRLPRRDLCSNFGHTSDFSPLPAPLVRINASEMIHSKSYVCCISYTSFDVNLIRCREIFFSESEKDFLNLENELGRNNKERIFFYNKQTIREYVHKIHTNTTRF